MANPQLEDGFTRLANEILEVLAKTKLNGTQFRIVLAAIRCTYGYNKKEHEMSNTFIAEATGISLRQVKRELKKLVENNILIITDEGSYTEPKKIMFNKYHDTWNLELLGVKKVSPEQSESSDESDTTASGESDTTEESGETPSTPPKDSDSKGLAEGSDGLDTSGESDTQKRHNKDMDKDKATTATEGGDGLDTTTKYIGSLANEVGGIYSTLTGSPVYRGQDMIIFSFLKGLDEKSRDLEVIKEAMERAKENWKPKYPGDKIRSFKYFIPAIREAIAFKEAKENYGSTTGNTKQSGSKQSPAGKESEYKPNSGFRKFDFKDD